MLRSQMKFLEPWIPETSMAFLEDKCVQVHLTWKMDKEIDSRWPKTRVI